MSPDPTAPDAEATFPADHIAIIHDLGNLIQIASSAVNITARNPKLCDPDLVPVIAGARSSLERAGALVRQAVASARQRHTERTLINIPKMLTDISSLLAITWDPNTRLQLDITTDIPEVECDALSLQNAIINLLLNARDAMPEGGVVTVHANAVTLDLGEAVELRITDNGIGMKAETIDRAFDPFFTTKASGLGGIGLPMVARFVQKTGGHIIIESEFGLGTTVWLQLPAIGQPTTTATARRLGPSSASVTSQQEYDQ
jgi:signal transduction histidine kinase